MRAVAVAGVDEGRARPGAGGQRGHRAVVGVAHDEAIHAHRFEVLHRVERGLALLGRRGDARRSPACPRPVASAASWKELRVRVDGSKNSVQTVRPASAVAQARCRRCACGAQSPRPRSSRDTSIAAGRPSSVSRWRSRPSGCSCGHGGMGSCSVQSGARAMRDCGFGQPAFEDDHRGQRVELRGLVALALRRWRGRRRSAARLRSNWCVRPPARPAMRSAWPGRGRRRARACGSAGRRRPGSPDRRPPASSGRHSLHPAVERRPVGAGVAHVQHADFARAHGTVLPTATPMRRAPTSKASKVMVAEGAASTRRARQCRTTSRHRRRSIAAAACQRIFQRRVEKDRLVGRHGQPGVLRQLFLQLARRPAGVAQRDQEMRRAVAAGQLLEDVARGADRQVLGRSAAWTPKSRGSSCSTKPRSGCTGPPSNTACCAERAERDSMSICRSTSPSVYSDRWLMTSAHRAVLVVLADQRDAAHKMRIGQ